MKKNLRMVLEIVLLPVVITYLLYLLCSNFDFANILFIVVSVIVAFEVMIKAVKYVFTKGPGIIKKIFAVLLAINNVLLLFSIYWTNYQTSGIYMSFLFYVTLGVLLLYLLISAVIFIVRLFKNKGRLYTNVTTSFIYLLSLFVLIMSALLIYFKG